MSPQLCRTDRAHNGGNVAPLMAKADHVALGGPSYPRVSSAVDERLVTAATACDHAQMIKFCGVAWVVRVVGRYLPTMHDDMGRKMLAGEAWAADSARLSHRLSSPSFVR